MGSLRSLDGFGLFLVQFQALISYVRIFGNFEYKSYVDFDEIWCGSLIDTINYYHRIEIDGSQHEDRELGEMNWVMADW